MIFWFFKMEALLLVVMMVVVVVMMVVMMVITIVIMVVMMTLMMVVMIMSVMIVMMIIVMVMMQVMMGSISQRTFFLNPFPIARGGATGKTPHSSANRQIVISVGKTALTKDNH